MTTDELATAMDAVRATAQGPDGMAAALAHELGLSTADVTAALESARPDGGPGAPPDGAFPPNGATPPDGSTAPGTTATPDGTTPS